VRGTCFIHEWCGGEEELTSEDYASLKQVVASGDELRLRRIVDQNKRVRLNVSRRAIQIYSSSRREVVASLQLPSRLASLSASGAAPTAGSDARQPSTPHGRARDSRLPQQGVKGSIRR
jgi:hypothetical protein